MDSEGEEEADLVVDPMVEEETHLAVVEEAILEEGENMAVAEGTLAEEVEIDTMTGEAVEEGGMTVDREADRHRGVYLALIREVGVHRDDEMGRTTKEKQK